MHHKWICQEPGAHEGRRRSALMGSYMNQYASCTYMLMRDAE